MPAPTEFNDDLLVIGSGPGGLRAAVQATELGEKVAVVEKQAVVGWVCINVGTVPGKTFCEKTMHLSGHNGRGLYGGSYAVKVDITVQGLLLRTRCVMAHELDGVRGRLHRDRVEVINAEASFAGRAPARREEWRRARRECPRDRGRHRHPGGL